MDSRRLTYPPVKPDPFLEVSQLCQ